MWKSIVAICVGASCGAVLRWWFGTRLNAIFPTIPLGTVAANLLSGYVIGGAVAFFAFSFAVALEWRLLVMTGCCGGLTTFSTFSAEVATLLQARQAIWGLVAEIKAFLYAKYEPDGYNLGVNVGEVAGQTVANAQLHVIPRYRGDVKNLRGDICCVIPAMQRY